MNCSFYTKRETKSHADVFWSNSQTSDLGLRHKYWRASWGAGAQDTMRSMRDRHALSLTHTHTHTHTLCFCRGVFGTMTFTLIHVATCVPLHKPLPWRLSQCIVVWATVCNLLCHMIRRDQVWWRGRERTAPLTIRVSQLAHHRGTQKSSIAETERERVCVRARACDELTHRDRHTPTHTLTNLDSSHTHSLTNLDSSHTHTLTNLDSSHTHTHKPGLITHTHTHKPGLITHTHTQTWTHHIHTHTLTNLDSSSYTHTHKPGLITCTHARTHARVYIYIYIQIWK